MIFPEVVIRFFRNEAEPAPKSGRRPETAIRPDGGSLSPVSLAKRTADNILWKGGSTSIVTVWTFVVLAVLANILEPSDFGLRGIILIMMGLLTLLADMGLGAAIVHERTVSREQFSTVFFLNVGVGFVLAATMFFGSKALAAFFQEERLGPILKVMSLAFVICSFGSMFMALLQKKLDFKTRSKIEIAEALTSGVSSIVFALLGRGVWSIVYGYILGAFLRVVLLWISADMRPAWFFRLGEVRSFLKFGVYVLGEQIVGFTSQNLDNIIVGRFLGMEALGYYSLAYSLMLTPAWKISDSVTRVIFPTFALIRDDNARIRDGYLRVLKFIALATFPIMAGMFAVSRSLIASVYGAKWLPAAAVLEVFCIVGAIQSILSTTSAVQYAKGRSDLSFKLNFVALIGNLVAFFVGVRYGIMGVAIAFTIWTVILSPVIQGITNRLVQLGARAFLGAFKIQAAGSLAIIAAVLGLRELVGKPMHFPPLIDLLVSAAAGVAVYGLVVLWKGRGLLKELADLLRGSLRGGGKESPAEAPAGVA